MTWDDPRKKKRPPPQQPDEEFDHGGVTWLAYSDVQTGNVVSESVDRSRVSEGRWCIAAQNLIKPLQGINLHLSHDLWGWKGEVMWSIQVAFIGFLTIVFYPTVIITGIQYGIYIYKTTDIPYGWHAWLEMKFK